MPPRRGSKAKKGPAPSPSPAPGTAPPPTPSPPPTEIVPPGTGAGAAGDVEQAIRTINALYLVGALDTALAIGDYILRTYLGGDEARLALGEEEPSLRKLADHPGLGFPKSTLWTAIGVYRQYPTLPEAVRRSLTLTHQRLLLAVTSVQAKAQLASEAVRRKWSASNLEKAVNRWLESRHLPPIGGYPDHPALVAAKRGANAILRAAHALEKGPPPTAAERKDVLSQAGLAEKRLERLHAALATAATKARKGR